jgi:hypothetical protein
MLHLTEEQVRWLGATMVARMLTNAADKQRRGQLMDALRDWFPGEDLSVIEQAEVAERVAAQFRELANLVDIRTKKLAAENPPRSVPLPNCPVIP